MSNSTQNIATTSPISDTAEHPVAAGLAAPAPAPAPVPTPPAKASRPKLRDSCNSCSSSKVKCGREKPACARCVNRGLSCEYVVTKRAGRRKQSQNGVRPGPTTNTSSRNTPTLSNFFMSPTSIMPSTYPEFLRDTSLSPSNAFSGPILDTSDFDHVLASPVGVSGVDFGCALDFMDIEPEVHSHLCSPELEVPLEGDTDHVFDFHNDTRAFSYSGESDAFNNSLNFTMPQSPSGSKASSTSGKWSGFSFHKATCTTTTTTSTSEIASPKCLERALALLKQLSPQGHISPPCSRPMQKCDEQECRRGKTITAGADPAPTLQAVIVENEQTIEAISNMLKCPCSKDTYLLMIMSIVVFRVLSWYATAARGTFATGEGGDPAPGSNSGSSTPSSSKEQQQQQQQQSPRFSGVFLTDDEEDSSMAGQMVLRELHRVQRLINELSRHLKVKSAAARSLAHQRHPGDDSSGTGGLGNMEHLVHSLLDSETWSPFSSDVLDHMEADLRQRLRSLSLEIVDMLRQY